jgi:molybdate transport system substrate-binding protein
VTDVDAPGGGRLSGMLRRAVKHRLIASVLALLLVVAGAACGSDHNDPKGAASTTTTGAATTAPSTPAGSASGPNNISIFASAEVSQALEQLTSTYKTAHSEVTFQVTTGTSSQLVDQVRQGARPNLYIDDERALGRLNKPLVHGTPAPFGTDVPVIIVKKGNPKHVGEDAFAPQPATTSGMCSNDLVCGVMGRLYLGAVKVPAVPDIVENNEAALVDDVAVGNADVALVMRSASRNRFFKVSFLLNWYAPKLEVNYKLATLTESAAAQEFVKYVTTFAAARQILAARGFLSFYDIKTPTSTPTTVAATATTKKP